MATTLSTKILSEPQRELVLNSGIGLVEYDAINIKFIDFEVSKDIENAIFTSQNAVKALAKCHIERSRDVSVKRCFCIGNKTAKALEDLGFNVVEVAENASTLAKRIIEKYSYSEFTFFCGNKRRDELPQLLRDNYTKVDEVIVYKTTLTKKTFERMFDAVMCFSPSGVQSYCEVNQIPMKEGISKLICIGKTTASEAKKYTDNVVVANSTSVESVIAKTVKMLNN